MVVHRYVVLDQLGKGGMGMVYSAYDPKLDRQIALKILRAGSRSPDDDQSRRLLREAQALAQLAHPNVIAIHDVGTFDGDVFLSMELVQGKSLRKWLRERDIEPTYAELVDVFVQAGRGLAAAHEAGLIHRDFKPDNIMVGDDGRVRVLDFGLARATPGDVNVTVSQAPDITVETGSHDSHPSPSHHESVSQPPFERPATENSQSSLHTPDVLSEDRTSSALLRAQLTHMDGIAGTPAYMSPEQFRGERLDGRSDQYSFCVVLFEALCGFRPIKAKRYYWIRKYTLAGDLQPFPANVSIPRRVKRLIRRGLSLEPADRFPDMGALLHELERDPLTIVRRAIAVLALVTLAALVSFWAAKRGVVEDREAMCERAADRANAVWNPEIAVRVGESFAQSGRAHANDSFDRVHAIVDSYIDDWRTMRVDTCKATHIRGEQSGTLLDARMRCLDRRLASAEALIDLFGNKVSGAVVDGSVEAVYRLPTLDLCADADALSVQTPLPANPVLRVRIGDLFERLDYVRTLEVAGRYLDGLELAEEVLRQARELGYDPLVAESMYLSGHFAEKTGSPEHAEKLLRDATEVAARAGLDGILADVWIELVWNVGYTQARFVEADWIGQMARVAIEQLRSDKWRRAAKLESMLGSVAWAHGKLDDALESQQKALDLRRSELGDSHPDVAESLDLLGTVLYRLGRYHEAADAQRQALELRIEWLGEKHPDVGKSYTNLGVSLVALGEFEQAHEDYLRALEINDATYGQGHAKVGLTHHNLGALWWLRGRYERARLHFDKAVTIFEQSYGLEHPFTAYPLTGMGQVCAVLGDTTCATEALERAHVIREAGNSSPADRALTEFYWQWSRWLSGERTSAVAQAMEKAYQIYRESPARIEAEVTLMAQWLEPIPRAKMAP